MTQEGFERGYLNYLKVKRKKHKTKADLLFINQKKHLFEVFHEEMLRYLIYIEKAYKIEELHSLFSLPRRGVICMHHIDATDVMSFSPNDVHKVVTTILHDYEIPLFSDKVERFIKGAPPNKMADAQNACDPPNKMADAQNACDGGEPMPEIEVFRAKFLEFVSPVSFSFNKLEIIRKELVEKFAPINHELEAFKAVIGDSKNEFADITHAGILYERKMLPLVKVFQAAMDENMYFQQLANSGDETEVFMLYYCACRAEDLLMLFEKVSGIPKVSIDRAREELTGKINSERTTFFLYLKTKKYE